MYVEEFNIRNSFISLCEVLPVQLIHGVSAIFDTHTHPHTHTHSAVVRYRIKFKLHIQGLIKYCDQVIILGITRLSSASKMNIQQVIFFHKYDLSL